MTISSVQNPRIKELVLLQQKSSERRKRGLFVVEGQREIAHCLEAGYEVDCIYYCPQLFTGT
jgi:TrmH family RNA methyltransferase